MTAQISAWLENYDGLVYERMRELHGLIASHLPEEVEETIYYNLPTFMYPHIKRPIVTYSPAASHISFVTTDHDILLRYEARLTGYTISGTTLRLPYDKPFPEEVIADILADRVHTLLTAASSRPKPAPKPRNEMEEFVRDALIRDGLMDEYRNRPGYQRNDYLGWIQNAKTEPTRQKRLAQMLDELRRGGLYMKMPHPPSAKG